MSGPDLLAAGRPEATALVGPDVALTYQALRDRVEARTAALGEESSGRLVPLVVEADVDAVVELLALWSAGAIPVPLHPRLRPAELADARERLSAATPPEGAWAVLWTSGTSGRPRGVALSSDNLRASTTAAAERLGLGPDDVWLATLSPAHVGGLAVIVRSLTLGGTLCAFGSPSPERISALLDGVPWPDVPGTERPPLRPTRCSLVPTQLHRVLAHRGGRPAPEGLRSVLVGGAHAPGTLVSDALARGWPIALTYGATEASSQVATAPPEVVRAKPHTVGEPLPGVEVRVASDGELLVRGPTLAVGYVGGAEAGLPLIDGFYATGDLGRFDGDGHLRITGRRSDRIVTGGVTVDAHEVEETLRGHPSVVDACVVGVPDEEWGERVGAWIEPVVGELDLEELEQDVRARLSGPKRPRLWHVEPGIPRNPNGKADRGAVRERLAGGQPPPGR